jgi:hypothetical protein
MSEGARWRPRGRQLTHLGRWGDIMEDHQLQVMCEAGAAHICEELQMGRREATVTEVEAD